MITIIICFPIRATDQRVVHLWCVDSNTTIDPPADRVYALPAGITKPDIAGAAGDSAERAGRERLYAIGALRAAVCVGWSGAYSVLACSGAKVRRLDSARLPGHA